MTPAELQTLYASALDAFSGGRWDGTESHCRRILAVDPRHADALHLLGVLAHRAGRLDDAIDLMRRATDANPAVAEFHSNLGAVLSARGDHVAAAAACREALALHPNLPDAHYNLGNALRGGRGSGDVDAAIDAYRRALELRFDFPPAHNNLANLLRDQGRLAEAALAYRRALMFRPDDARTHSNFAAVLEDAGQVDQALLEHRRAVESAPLDADVASNRIVALHYGSAVDASAIADAAARWNASFGRPRATSPAAWHDRDPERVLHVGYVSADLRLHASAFFLLPLVEAHDRSRVRVRCYPTTDGDDDLTTRLRAASDRWSSLAGLDDDAAAARIRGDAVDILVDCTGHARGRRLTLFASKPAPIEVSAFGLPGTTGLQAIDYRLTDDVQEPDGERGDGGPERVVRIPGGARCFSPLWSTDAPTEPPAARAGFVTFGSFAGWKKIGPDALDAWARILAAVPTARLLLKARAFRDGEVAAAARRRFGVLGIADGRIDLLPDEPSMLRHLTTYERVDVALDPFPFNGVATTCEALWMGVPVVTLAGRRAASRIGASLLSSATLPELIAPDMPAYVKLAAALAADVPRIGAYRRELRERLRTSPLMDAAGHAARVEDAYRTMWRTWCATPPR